MSSQDVSHENAPPSDQGSLRYSYHSFSSGSGKFDTEAPYTIPTNPPTPIVGEFQHYLQVEEVIPAEDMPHYSPPPTEQPGQPDPPHILPSVEGDSYTALLTTLQNTKRLNESFVAEIVRKDDRSK